VARRFQFSNSFSAGEIAPELMMRSDLQVRNEALKTGSNIRILQGGGFKRRPGTRDLASLPGDAVIKTLGVGDDDARVLVFSAGRFEERGLDGALIEFATGAPWGADDLATMQFAIEEDRVIVTGDFFPQAVTRDAFGVWTIGDHTFKDGLNGAKRQPYWRFAPPGVEMELDAYTGAGVTVGMDEDVFVAGHVGARFRYSGVEVEITGVTTPRIATGTVIGSVYPTLLVTVASTSGFLVGQEVEGDTTEVRGAVWQVVSGTQLKVQLTEGYTYFSSTEKLVGPTAFSTISAVSLNATPAVTTDWDEQMISDARGYPRACALHKTRLLFGDFPQAKNALAASAVGDITDFDAGDGADRDAVIESIGQDATLGIKHFGSTEQLIVLTEAGPHYIPEQVAAPFSATNVELLKIGPEAAGAPSPTLASEGMLFSEARSGRLMAALPTGNVRRSWDVADLSELAYHLMGTPKELVLLAASSESDRLVCSLKDDGSLAVMNYRRGQQFSAWTTWSTEGEWRSITTAGGSLYAVSKRTIGGSPVYRLEVFQEGVWGDGVVSKPAGNASHLNGAAVGVWSGDNKVATKTVASGDVTSLPSGVTVYELGFDFDVQADVVPPIDGEIGLSRKIRITRAWLDVRNTLNLRINGYAAVGYSNVAGLGGAVEAFTGQATFHLLGRSRDQTLSITQSEGGPLEVRSLTMEVTT